MQRPDSLPPDRRPLSAAPGPPPRARRRRGLLYVGAALAVFPGGFALGRLVPLSSRWNLVVPVVVFGGYLLLGWRALATLFPGLDRVWRKGKFKF